MSMSAEDSMTETEADPFLVRLQTVGCPRCADRFQRPVDLEVHLERHQPVRVTTVKERADLAHCPKGCGRWIDAGRPFGAAHATLCDGSPPITRSSKMAYRWWCEEHQFGTDGPKPWGWHKKEHHAGETPACTDKNGPDVVGSVLGLLRQEKARLDRETARINAAIKALEVDLQPVREEAQA